MPEPVYRHIGDEIADETEPLKRGRHVIAVIGINKYEHWRTLNNGVSDARAIQQIFKDLGFIELTKPLYDQKATLEAITALVQDQLPPLLKPDDNLVLFFAGHGHNDEKKVADETTHTGYLIPKEAPLPEERKFSKYIKLESFLDDLDKLPARHVLVILDSCYSGFALSKNVDIRRDADPYSPELHNRISRRVISSAHANQSALDNGPITGHSLFTGELIEAIELSQADTYNRGHITSSELGLYVQREVIAWSKAKGKEQTPDFGAFGLDNRGEMFIPLIGETQNKRRAIECMEAGKIIGELGWLTDDRMRFLSAIRQFREANHYAALAKIDLPEAELELGKTLFAAGKTEQAAQVLSEMAKRCTENPIPLMWLYLGMAYAKLKRNPDAKSMLEKYLNSEPDSLDALWVKEYLGVLNQNKRGNVKALLIGINQYNQLSPLLMQLKGCVNDAKNLMYPLVSGVKHKREDIVVLTDGAATSERIKQEFNRLISTKPDDLVIVHYSGHAVPASKPDIFGPNPDQIYLVVNDTKIAPDPGKRENLTLDDDAGHESSATQAAPALVNGITASELHEMMQAIPARKKILILDTHASTQIIDLAEKQGVYALLLASDSAEITYESQITINNETIDCGMLTKAIYQTLSAHPQKIWDIKSWAPEASEIVCIETKEPSQYKEQQSPLFLNHTIPDDEYVWCFEFYHRKKSPEISAWQLQKYYDAFCSQIHANHPRSYNAFGTAFLQRKMYPQAIQAFTTAFSQSKDHFIESRLELGCAYILNGQYAEGIECVQQYSAGRKCDLDLVNNLLTVFKDTKTLDNTAIVIYEHRNDEKAQMIAALLIQQWGFRPDQINLLPAEEVEAEDFIKLYKLSAEISYRSLVLFIYIGFGGWNGGRDGRTAEINIGKSQYLALKDLGQFAPKSENHLYTIIDGDPDERYSLPESAEKINLGLISICDLSYYR
jgi:tetratricopeptide (TPR) repeat protein/uncharacterized caspase-like protein